MPSNAGNVGVDYSFGYFDANTNALVDLGDVQSVKIAPAHHPLKNMPYNKAPKFDYIPDGYKINFTITRTGGGLEDLEVARQKNFNAGGINRAGYLNQTTKNADGSTNRYQYTGFVFILNDHGDVSREKLVTLTGEGMASEKINVA